MTVSLLGSQRFGFEIRSCSHLRRRGDVDDRFGFDQYLIISLCLNLALLQAPKCLSERTHI